MKTKSLIKKFAMLMSIIMILTSLAMVASAAEPTDFDVWDGVSYDLTPFEGIAPNAAYDASVNSPIIIDSAAKLAGLSKFVNDGKVRGGNGALPGWPIYITKNIDLGNHPFKSIGCDYAVAMFSGLLEGRLNGEEGVAATIKNLNIIDPSSNNTGFVGTLRGGAVKNLAFENAVVGHADTQFGVAIAVGYPCKTSEVSGITVKNAVVIGGSTVNVSGVGAIIGVMKCDNEITLKDLHAENVTFVCEDYHVNPIGGLVGIVQSKQPVHFEDCSFVGGKIIQADTLGTIETDLPVGGIVGTTSNEGLAPTITMKNCVYRGSLNYAGERTSAVAAFVGNLVAGGSLTLENCEFDAENVEALVGTADTVTVTLTGTKGNVKVPVLKGGSAECVVNGELDAPEAPVDPEPTDPQPTEPKPTESKPTEPKPTEPKPTEPAPSNNMTGIIIAVVAVLAVAVIVIVVLKKKKG